MRALLKLRITITNNQDETGIRKESTITTDMTTEKAKRLAKYYAIKEYRYMRDHSFDISLFAGTTTLSGFTFFVLSNL